MYCILFIGIFNKIYFLIQFSLSVTIYLCTIHPHNYETDLTLYFVTSYKITSNLLQNKI